MNWRAKQVAARVTVIALVVGLLVISYLLISSPVTGQRILTVVVWCGWAVLFVAIVLRSFFRLRRPRTAGAPVDRLGEPIEDLYSGRVRHEVIPRDPAEYSAHGSPPE